MKVPFCLKCHPSLSKCHKTHPQTVLGLRLRSLVKTKIVSTETGLIRLPHVKHLFSSFLAKSCPCLALAHRLGRRKVQEAGAAGPHDSLVWHHSLTLRRGRVRAVQVSEAMRPSFEASRELLEIPGLRQVLVLFLRE